MEGTPDYSAIRFEYGKNGEAVGHVLGENWTWDGNPASCPTNYNVAFAREFRYDDARQRYYNAVLDPVWAKLGVIEVESVIWSDYDGDEVYGDYTVAGGSPPTITAVRSFEPGLGRSAWSAGVPGSADYYHTNHLGTTRCMTDSGVAQLNPLVHTAFGELIAGNQDGTADRYGYVGTSGYQVHDNFPYLHVGHRYYDPSTGRFVQRDPIGIQGGPNVYAYSWSSPVSSVDPSGLVSQNWEPPWGRPPPPGSLPPSKGPIEIMEEVNNMGDKLGKSDDWRHFVVSCRVCRETLGGLIYVLPGGFLKEIWDNIGSNRPGWRDSLSDMRANVLGWWEAARASGMSCTAAAGKRFQ